MSDTIDEDLIEQTIRRVAEAKAAREAEQAAPAAEREPGDDGHEAQDLEDVGEPASDGDEQPHAADEDLIEQTIRRVAAAKAEQQAALARAADDESGPDRAAAALHAWRRDQDEDPAPAAFSPRPVEAAAEPASPEPPLQTGALERDLAATNDALRALTARLDAVLPLLERIASARPAGPVSPGPSGDTHWDEETPQIARMPVGLPPRPAILRDPAPAPAVEQPPAEEEAVIDTRPLPKPLPPLQVERRGLDLLPRTYRVTVEDKRRGVDLVPLHRALLGMDGVRDMSLLSYNNGIAIVSLETVADLDPQMLERAVSHAMSRGAQVEVHNEHTMVVKLAED